MDKNTPSAQNIHSVVADYYKKNPTIKEILDLWKISKKEYDSLLFAMGKKGNTGTMTSTINISFNGNYSRTTPRQISNTD